jgi:hypothetical protein
MGELLPQKASEALALVKSCLQELPLIDTFRLSSLGPIQATSRLLSNLEQSVH